MTALKFPRIVSFGNQKGGCGKTSTAVNSLGYFAKKGLSVVLIDCDEQRSASRTAEQLGLPYEEILDTTKLLDTIPVLLQKYNLVIIDGPANASEMNRAIISESGLVIIPCRPTAYDIESTEKTIKFLRNAQRNALNPPVGVAFLNGVTNNSTSLKQAQEYFAVRAEGITFLSQSIPHRQCVGDIGLENKTIFQMKSRPAKEVAAKYCGLFDEALKVYNLAQG
jgi:chromosome partitioning protein